jgi:hypothetical protein
MARPDLKSRLGDYCSYCEMKNPTDVEHKLPKAHHPRRKLSWDNFLLACKFCNGIKLHQQDPGRPTRPTAALALYLWPDTDNTARAFMHNRRTNSVIVAIGLPASLAAVALRTIQLTGVDRTPGTTPPATAKDERWRKREEAWNTAEEARQKVIAQNTPEMRAVVGMLAAATGFWSVWRVVFVNDAVMLDVIDKSFKGTASECFHPVTRQPVVRPGGTL